MPILAVGDVCPDCAGFGVVAIRRRIGGHSQTFGRTCRTCLQVRPAQLRLNAEQARAIARGLLELHTYDVNGEMLRPCASYWRDAAACSHPPDLSGRSHAMCAPPW